LRASGPTHRRTPRAPDRRGRTGRTTTCSGSGAGQPQSVVVLLTDSFAMCTFDLIGQQPTPRSARQCSLTSRLRISETTTPLCRAAAVARSSGTKIITDGEFLYGTPCDRLFWTTIRPPWALVPTRNPFHGSELCHSPGARNARIIIHKAPQSG